MDNKKNTSFSTSDILQDVVRQTLSDKISIGDLIEVMSYGGFGLVMMIFSLPIIIPLPPPFPSLISLPLLVFSVQMIIGFVNPKLPKFLSEKKISRNILAIMVEKSSPLLSKVDKMLKPRLLFLTSPFFERIIGVFTFIFALSILLPLPLSNFLPGIGILVTSFGMIGRDGVVIISGLIIGIFGLVIVAIALFVGVEALTIFKDFVFKLF